MDSQVEVSQIRPAIKELGTFNETKVTESICSHSATFTYQESGHCLQLKAPVTSALQVEAQEIPVKEQAVHHMTEATHQSVLQFPQRLALADSTHGLATSLKDCSLQQTQFYAMKEGLTSMSIDFTNQMVEPYEVQVEDMLIETKQKQQKSGKADQVHKASLQVDMAVASQSENSCAQRPKAPHLVECSHGFIQFTEQNSMQMLLASKELAHCALAQEIDMAENATHVSQVECEIVIFRLLDWSGR